jgi:hypothetical protein
MGALAIERITVRRIIAPHKRLSLLFLGTLSLVVFFASWSGIYFHAVRIVDRLDEPKFSIYNSILRIRPQSGVFAVGYPQRVSIIVRSGGEALNTIDATLKYDPDVVDVTEIQTERSICPEEFFIEKTIDSQEGVVRIICGIPGEGFTDVRGIVADIIMVPKVAGESSVTFDESTQVLASDGLGSNVLRSVSGAYYRSFVKTDDKTFSNTSYVIPFSSTHENSTRWYSSRQVGFKWTSIEGAEYVYEFTQNGSSTMMSPKITTGDTVTVQAPTDGVYYFKVAPRKDGVQGKVSVLMVKIDTTSPRAPVIRVSDTSVKADEVVRFELSSEDALSGVQPNFYVSINGSVYLPGSSRLFIPFKTPGIYKVNVRVFDNAENYSDATVNVTVKKE